MKTATKLKEEAIARGEDTYFTGKACKNGHVSPRKVKGNVCIECRTKHRTEWDSKNLDRKRELRKNFKKNNPESNRLSNRKYYRKNKGKVTHLRRLREERVKIATPKWADLKKIEQFYIEARYLTNKTKIKHEVDHIIPLKHPLVCGLHCPDNLQIITKRANRSKSNKFNPDEHSIDHTRSTKTNGSKL